MNLLRYQPATDDHVARYSEPPLHATLREHGDPVNRQPVKSGFVNLKPVSLASHRLGTAFQSLILDTVVGEEGGFSYPSVDDFIDRHFGELGLSADILSQEAPLRQCLDRIIEDVLEHAAAIFRRDTLTFAREQELSISSKQLQPMIDRQLVLLKAQLLNLMPVFVQALFRRYLRNAAGLANAYLEIYEASRESSARGGQHNAAGARHNARSGNPKAGHAGFSGSDHETLRSAIDARKRELIFHVLGVANAYTGLEQRPLVLLDQPVSVTPEMNGTELDFVARVARLARQRIGAVDLTDALEPYDDAANVDGVAGEVSADGLEEFTELSS